MLNLLRLKTSVFAISFKGPSQYSRLIWPVRGNWDVFLPVSLWNLSKYKNIAFYVFLSNESFLFKFLTHLIWKLRGDFLIACRHTSVRLFVRPSVTTLFTFSLSSPESLRQFQPNLAQCILGWWGFKFVQTMIIIDNYEKAIIHWRNLKIFSSTTGQFQPNLAQSIFVWRGFKFVQMKGHTLWDNYELAKTQCWKLKNLLQHNHRTNFNQTWHVTEIQVCENEGNDLFQGEI